MQLHDGRRAAGGERRHLPRAARALQEAAETTSDEILEVLEVLEVLVGPPGSETSRQSESFKCVFAPSDSSADRVRRFRKMGHFSFLLRQTPVV